MVVLLGQCANSHAACAKDQMVAKRIQLLGHLPYSSDRALADIFLFRRVKEAGGHLLGPEQPEEQLERGHQEHHCQ